MSNHYSDYLKKSISIKDLKFDKVQESDKEVLKQVRKARIKENVVFLVLLSIAFLASAWFFVNFIIIPPDNLFSQIIDLLLLGGVMFVTGELIFGIVGGARGIRRGVVLAANRVQEVKDNRNATYQYVFDIYMEDRDETLMSYTVDKEVFGSVQPGDGVIIAKIGRKIKVLGDPDREGVMDVSNIKSGVDR